MDPLVRFRNGDVLGADEDAKGALVRCRIFQMVKNAKTGSES